LTKEAPSISPSCGASGLGDAEAGKRSRRILQLLTLNAALLTLFFATPLPGRSVVVAVTTGSLPILLILLAVSRRKTVRALVYFLAALGVSLEATALAIVTLSHRATPLDPWLLGLPPGVWFLLLGFWLLPLVIVSIAYPLTFPRVFAGDDSSA
jgi:hypothetical protein